MCLRGHALEIVEDDQTPTRTSKSKHIMRSLYLKKVKILMNKCKGRELPGTFNPLVVGDLFNRQCKPWEAITQNLAEQIHEAATTTFNKMLGEICDENTRSRLMKGLVQPTLHLLRKELKGKLDELLEPHLSIHPITYDDYLTDNVQKIQGERHDRAFDRLALESCGYTEKSLGKVRIMSVEKEVVQTLLSNLKNGTRPNVEDYSVSLAADVAVAYYKVALKKFVDDLSVNAVETCLIRRLPSVFAPTVVWDLSDEDVERFGSEDDKTVNQRAELEKKLIVLENGLRDLDGFSIPTGS